MGRVSATSALTQVVVVALLGLVALPALLAPDLPPAPSVGQPLSLTAGLWLAGAVLLGIWLLALVPSLATRIAGLVDGLQLAPAPAMDERPDTSVAATVAARWLIAVGEVVLIQAMLRRPLVAFLGVVADPTTVDATFAATTLILLLLILIWLHRSARPLVEAATWQALDTLIPTTGSEHARAIAEQADAALATVGARTSRDSETTSDATRPAPAAAATLADPSEQPTARAETEPTLETAEATRPAPSDASHAAGGSAARPALGDATPTRPEEATRPAPRETPTEEGWP